MKKRLFAVLLIVFFAMSFSFADGISVHLNGEAIHFDVQPQLIQNRTMVPLRAIFEALGLEVGWDPATRTVTGTGNGKVIKLQVGNLSAAVNDQPVALDVSAVIVDGRTLVPVRFIAQSSGADVEWDGVTKTVRIALYASQEAKLKSEINAFLNKETVWMNELMAERTRLNQFKTSAQQEISRLKGRLEAMVSQADALMAKPATAKLGSDSYYGPLNSSNLMHGFGVYAYTSGDLYIGDFANGKYTGFGAYLWADGDYYIGQFLSNDFSGLGYYEDLGSSFKYGTFKRDVSSGMTYYEDLNDGYFFVGQMVGTEFGLGQQAYTNSSERITWRSASSNKTISYEGYSDGEFMLYDQADQTSGLSFVVESYFIDTHMIRYMDLDTEQVSGNGVSYILGSDYVYYGPFFDRFYESAVGTSYYNMKGDFFEFEKAIDAILAATITADMTDLQKEEALHDYLVKKSRYNPSESADNIYPSEEHMAYHLIFNGQGICEGYAEALNILLNRAGIPSVVIGGFVGEPGEKDDWLGHAWNYVKIGNSYYHVDATWNDPVPDQGNAVIKDYFNASDSQMLKDHDWDESLDEIEAFKKQYPLQ